MDHNTLMTASSLGLLDEAALQQQIMQKIREDVVRKPAYKISRLPNGRWQTYVRDGSGNRIQIKASSYDGIIDKLVLFKTNQDNPEYMTLDQLYQKWHAYRKETVSNPNTLLREEQHYKRYFEGHPFFRKRFIGMHRPDLKAFCCATIRGETVQGRGKRSCPGPLTRKAWSNAKSILNGMFAYAADKEWIPQNPLAGMTFDRGLFRQPVPKDKTTEIYNSDERAAFTNWCMSQFSETKDAAYLLPVLNFRLGMRIGEAVALKWDDLESGKCLNILRMEFKNRSDNSVCVIPHTKNFRTRKLLVPSASSELLDMIRESAGSSEWIFSRDGERLTSREAQYVFEKYAKDTGCARKSSHKVRKTCGSNMCKAGFTPRQCADYLGNTVRVFEEYYEYDTDSDEEFIRKLDKIP